jgi:hypothetical protein
MSRPDLLDRLSEEQLVELFIAVADRVRETVENPYESNTPQAAAFSALFRNPVQLRPLRILDLGNQESWSEFDLYQFLYGRPRLVRGSQT